MLAVLIQMIKLIRNSFRKDGREGGRKEGREGRITKQWKLLAWNVEEENVGLDPGDLGSGPGWAMH